MEGRGRLPLTSMPENQLKKFDLTPSKRPSILHGAKYVRGFVIRPEQMISLFHDTMPSLPIPKDAEHCGIGIEDSAEDSELLFYYTSKIAFDQHCFAINPNLFLRTLVNLADGLLPADSELDGIEVSRNFTVIMLRVKSAHWPETKGQSVPLYHLRYEEKELYLVHPAEILKEAKRIRVQ